MIARIVLLAAALAAVAVPASAGPPYAVQRIADGYIVTRTYSGAPYAIPGHRWLDVARVTPPPTEDGVTAVLPCSIVPAAARVASSDPDAPDCVDSEGADEWVRLIDPPVTDPAVVAGTLHTGLGQVGWQDTGPEPTQALAVLAAVAEARRVACTTDAASPTVCGGMDGLLARRDRGYALTTGDELRISRCAAASAQCDTPTEARRATLEVELRAAYATLAQPPGIQVGWPVGVPVQ